jgi:hypothetical protein
MEKLIQYLEGQVRALETEKVELNARLGQLYEDLSAAKGFQKQELKSKEI